jgi:signal transduction histidine kinase
MGSSRMLPGGLLQEPGTAKRTTRDWIVDAVMLLAALSVGGIALGGSEARHSQTMVFVDLVIGLLCIIPLWWRRKHPLAVALITAPCGAISAMAAGPGLVALFNVALRGSRRAIIISVLVGTAGGVVFPFIYPEATEDRVIEVIFAFVVPAVIVPWGLFTRTQRNLLRSSHERAQRLEAEQRGREQAAREAERRRIAGEMHDVLAHRLSLLSVHAGALEFHPDAPPDEVERAAGVIRATAHDALRDLREVVGVLRAGDGGADPPQPTLAEIGELIAQSRAAGMKVAARVDHVETGDLQGRTAYRVVQEGLTNARKHAPGAAVEVKVEAGLDLLVLVVSRRPGAPPERVPGTGTGLIGLSERVELAGGELHHGPNARGDFVLRAVLPL